MKTTSHKCDHRKDSQGHCVFDCEPKECHDVEIFEVTKGRMGSEKPPSNCEGSKGRCCCQHCCYCG